jgi:hypothetical protein
MSDVVQRLWGFCHTLRVEQLTQAVLAKAFRGELVPTEAELARREGRDYEPASALLDRIRAERAAAVDGNSTRAAGRRKRAAGAPPSRPGSPRSSSSGENRTT